MGEGFDFFAFAFYFVPTILVALIFQPLILVKFLKMKSLQEQYSVSMLWFYLFCFFLFMVSWLILSTVKSMLFPIDPGTAGAEVFLLLIFIGGILLSGMSLVGYLAIKKGEINSVNDNRDNLKARFIYYSVLIIDFVIILSLVLL